MLIKYVIHSERSFFTWLFQPKYKTLNNHHLRLVNINLTVMCAYATYHVRIASVAT